MVPPTDRKAPDTNKERVNTAVSAWQETLYDLIVRTSTDLPGDVEQALRSAQATEKPGNAAAALSTMLENVDLARRHGKPICQDTGTILFWVETPPGAVTQSTFREAAEKAITQATRDGVLRQNCVDTFSGRNTGNNLGHGSPVIHWHEIDSDAISVDLILKGGGCENVGAQYALPDTSLGASRNLDGVYRCVLDATVRAQGRGCAPGILGVAIGGDRATGYAESKEVLRRRIGERNPVPELADLELRILRDANTLGIGPMGFGGRTTLLDVFVGCRCRLPASYFVSLSYMCWAYRRRGVRTTSNGNPRGWH